VKQPQQNMSKYSNKILLSNEPRKLCPIPNQRSVILTNGKATLGTKEKRHSLCYIIWHRIKKFCGTQW